MLLNPLIVFQQIWNGMQADYQSFPKMYKAFHWFRWIPNRIPFIPKFFVIEFIEVKSHY